MNRPEETIHRQIAAYLRVSLAPPWVWWCTPNQRGTRKPFEVALLKALGVRPGIPDLFVAGEGRVMGMEIKSPDGALSAAQRDTIAALAEAGIPTVVVHSLDEAIAALEAMKAPLKARVRV